MTNVLSPLIKQQFFNNGAPNVGGLVFTYAAGSSTPVATYTATGATNTNPITLNSRGEADIWLTPNVGYKVALQDSSGNPIWTVDNIVNSQLITLYAGVDTGIVNALVLNFAANFTALTDGIVLYLIPANSNTGATTVNVNGLGVVPIINQNGTALTANELLAGQVATLMYKGGNWLLIQGAQQGIVSWGGTDTGAANAYVVALANQYFSYQAGNTLFWIPANSNSGASTINVKGLGTQSIFPANGGTLPAGAIQGGVLTEIVYTGAFFRLIYPNFYSGAFTCPATGLTTTPTMAFKYYVNNSQVTLVFTGVGGTSNATTFTLTGFPNGLQGSSQQITSPLLASEDNSAGAVSAYMVIPNQIGGSTVTLQINNASGNWTNVGTKQMFAGSFSYFLS